MTATPGQLKEKVGDLFKLPSSAIDYPWRALREAGLVTKGGRGPSAAKVTARDAALLLIALAGPLPAMDVVTAVRRYSGLPVQRWTQEEQPLPFAPAAVAEAETFGDALTALIASAADGTLAECRAQIARKADADPRVPGYFDLEVSLYGAYPQAGFRAYGGGGNFERMFSALPTDMDTLRDWKSDEPGDNSALKTTNRFHVGTIFALGELIGEPSQ